MRKELKDIVGKRKKLLGDWRMISEILKIINPGDLVKIKYNTEFNWSLAQLEV